MLTGWAAILVYIVPRVRASGFVAVGEEQELLTVPLAKLKTYGDRAFSIAASRQWNTLPLSIRKSPSIAIFKRHLKTYLFKEAYGF